MFLMPPDDDRPTRPDMTKPRCPKCRGGKHQLHVIEPPTSTRYRSQQYVCSLCHGRGWVDLETYDRWTDRTSH